MMIYPDIKIYISYSDKYYEVKIFVGMYGKIGEISNCRQSRGFRTEKI